MLNKNHFRNNNSIKLNIVMNFILTISNFIFPLITFPYVSRVLLPVGTGKVAFATSIVSYFAMVGMLGIPTYGIRACAKVRDNKEKLSKTVQEIMVINTIAMTLSLITYVLAIFLVPRMTQDKTLFKNMWFVSAPISSEFALKYKDKYKIAPTLGAMQSYELMIKLQRIINELTLENETESNFKEKIAKIVMKNKFNEVLPEVRIVE